ncbi:MAG: hypothetical protein OD814_001501 [Candidatus Alkanophagales archaeon MCA70_species_1]|nr:hypothetical protein [Candidatus Alkanophaga volatiphilum]
MSLSEDDPAGRRPDISKAKRFLRREPKIGLEGPRRIIRWFEKCRRRMP